MTSFSITSFKKAVSEFQEDSTQFPTQQKSNPLFPSERACEASGQPSVLRRFCELNIHSSGRQGNTIQTLFSVREESGVLYKHGLERQLAIVQMLGQHRPDVALIRKHVNRLMERRLHSSPSGRFYLTSRRGLEKSELDSI